MPFGDAILNLIGNKDPRLALLAAMQGGGTSGTPQPAGGTPPPTGTDPATSAPAAQPQQPQAYTSPPELMQLYEQLMKRQNRASMIDNGIAMIGASLAQPENRAGILSTFGSGGGGGGSSGSGAGGNDPISFISKMMEFQQSQSALAQKAAHRAALPAIAKQYGIDLQTAQYLFDTGELDKVLSDMVKPDNQVVSLEDGTQVIVNKATGEIGKPFGPPKKREIQIITDDRGNQFSVYKDTGERVGAANLVEGQGATENEQLWRADEADRKARGLPSRSLSQFIEQTGRARAGAANLGPNGVDYGEPPKDMAWKRDEKGNIAIDAEGRPVAVPIAGGPMDVEAKAAAEKADSKAGRDVLSAGVLSANVNDILHEIEASKDNWLVPGPTGWGALAQWLPETSARSVENSLATIKAKIGFDKLQQMRADSPTGGALGPVSDFENRLLQATYGSLDQFSDKDTFLRNLMRIDAVTTAVVNGVKDEKGNYRVMTQEDADRIVAEADARAKQLAGPDSKAAPQDDAEDLVNKYRSQ